MTKEIGGKRAKSESDLEWAVLSGFPGADLEFPKTNPGNSGASHRNPGEKFGFRKCDKIPIIFAENPRKQLETDKIDNFFVL